MPRTVDEWLDQHWDRAFSRQTTQVDTAKLLVTFSLLVAATFVAAALLGPPTNSLDIAAASVILVAFVVTGVILIWLDRLQWPNRVHALELQDDLRWDDDGLLDYVRLQYGKTEIANEKVVRIIRTVAGFQLLLAAVASVLAALSLFQPAA